MSLALLRGHRVQSLAAGRGERRQEICGCPRGAAGSQGLLRDHRVEEQEQACGGFGICFVREKILSDLRAQVKAGKDITREAVA